MARQQGLIITDIAYKHVDIDEARATYWEYFDYKDQARGSFIEMDGFNPLITRKEIELIKIRKPGHADILWGMMPEVAAILADPLEVIKNQSGQLDSLRATNASMDARLRRFGAAKFISRLKYLFTKRL